MLLDGGNDDPHIGSYNDRFIFTTSGSDALFLDSMRIESVADSSKGLEKCGSLDNRWGKQNNYYGYCLSTDKYDTFSWGKHSTCATTMGFHLDLNVYTYSSK